MGLPILYPDINGVRHSWVSINLVFGIHIILGITALNYGRTRERSYVYGTSPDPLGKARGRNAYKGDIEVFLSEWDLISSLPGYGDLSFPIVVNYSANGVDIITDILEGCTIDSSEAS